MEALKLEAKKRDIVGKQVKQLREEGMIPAVVYGHGVEAKNVAVDFRAFEKTLRQAGESSLVDLAINGDEAVKVLIQDVQYDPLRSTVIHADFRQVNMKEKLEANVILKLVGEAPAVKTLGAILVRNIGTIGVRCLPQYLVHEIEVDLSVLKNFDDSIKVGDITPPEGMEFMNGPEELIVLAQQPISEDELAALETKPEADVTAVKAANEEKKAERAAAADTDAKE
jgi:large subunit ribosomal protein L25